MRMFFSLVLVTGCTQEPPPTSTDADTTTVYCEQWQSVPTCHTEACPVELEMHCGHEQACKVWTDTGAFQCRTLFWCGCE